MNSEDAKEVFGSKEAVGDGGESSSLGFLITSIYPSNGGLGGGYVVYINGSKFTSDTTFALGGTPCLSTQILSSTSATCLAPPSGASGLVSVSASKVGDSYSQAGGFRYVGATVITSVSPAITPGTIPTRIVLTGTNFISGSLVNISHPNLPNSPCTSVNVVNSTTLECFTPVLTPNQTDTMSTSGVIPSIEVVTPDGGTSSLLNALTLTPAPIITGISFGGSGVTALPVDGVLNNGVSNFTLTLTGKYFVAGVSVRLASLNVPNCSSFNSNQIRCTTLPAMSSAGGFNFVITNLDGQSSSFNTNFVNKPISTGFSPTKTVFTGGDVTISGSGLSVVSPPTISIFKDSDNSYVAPCTIVSSLPVICRAPDLGEAMDVFFRIVNEYGYRADTGVYDFSGSTALKLSGDTNLERVAIGSTFNKSFIFANPSGTVDAENLAFDFSGFSTPAFSFVSNDCTSTLSAGNFCTLTLSFSPTALDFYESGNFTVSYDNGISNVSTTYSLKGRGVKLELGPPTLNFSVIPFGMNHAGRAPGFLRAIVINNDSNASVQIDSTNLSNTTDFNYYGGSYPGVFATPFSHQCPASNIIPANTYCVVVIEFKPQSTGAKTANFSLNYNSGHSTRNVVLSGSGGDPSITTCNPAALPYGGGSGIDADPWQICSEAQFLAAISETNDHANTSAGDDDFILMDDITFSAGVSNDITLFNSAFSFDGNGYKLIDYALIDPGQTNVSVIGGPNRGGSSIRRVQALNMQLSGLSAAPLGTSGSYDSFLQGQVLASGSASGAAVNSAGYLGLMNLQFIGDITSTSSFAVGALDYNQSVTMNEGLIVANMTGQTGVSGAVREGRSAVADYYVYAELNSPSGSANGIGGVGTINSHFYGKIDAAGELSGISRAQGFSNCSARGVFSSVNGRVGGLSSLIIPGHYIHNSYSTAKLKSASVEIGGLVGRFDGLELKNSFFAGQIDASSGGGGVAGISYQNSIVSKVYVAPVHSESVFIKNIHATSTPISRGTNPLTFNDGVFYLRDSLSSPYVEAGVEEFSQTQMINQTNFDTIYGSWDFNPAGGRDWKFSTSGYPYPILDWMEDDWMP